MEKYLPYYEKVLNEKTEKSINFEAVLQDYLPNALKIVRVTATPVTDECECLKDSLNVRGHIVFSAVYLSDFKDKLKCASFTVDFSHSFPARGIGDAVLEGGFCDCSISAFEEKGQILSQRKLNLSCKAVIGAQAYAMRKNELLDFSEDKSLKTLCSNVDSMEILKLPKLDFTLKQDISLEEGMPKIREIVSCECSVSSVFAEVSGAELVYSGNLSFSCLYLGEDEEEGGNYISFTKNLPFSESMPVHDIPDGSFILCRSFVSDCSADPVQDNYGESGSCSVSIGITTQAIAYCVTLAEILCDIFSTKHDCETEVRDITYDSFIGGISESMDLSESIRASLGSLTEVVSCGISIISVNSEPAANTPVFNVRANLSLCGTNELGGLESVNAPFSFKAAPKSELPELPERCKFDTYAHAGNCECKIENGEIKCNFTLELCSALYCASNAKTVTAVTLDEETEIFRDKSEYVIYYPDPNDTVWSAAKKYRVSPEALLSINGMSLMDTTFSDKKAVVIPRTDI